jgi:cytochrome d ubiquinol oxidase subunit I
MLLLLATAESVNLLPARMQMAFTLGFHIILACFGVGLPVLLLWAEWRFLSTGEKVWRTIARRWSKAFAVMFAIGAVSGTVLSFELGLLWPEFMGKFGGVIGLPFTMEGFAFFLEAIFVGIYLYGWDKLPPRVHWWTGVPIALAGFMSAAFVVTANAWMNAPQGFRLEAGKVVDIDPLAAMWNPASGAQMAHMILAAYMVTGFCVAGFYAAVLLRTNQSSVEKRLYARSAMALGLWLAILTTPPQMVVGDWAAKVVAKSQPVKLAAMEGHYETEVGAALRIGGIPDDEVKGLKEFPKEDRPPTIVVHIAFQIMVGIGSFCMLLVIWAVIARLRLREFPTSKLFLSVLVVSGPLSVLALEAGWTVTEVGRQPWIVQGVMRTSEAITSAPGVWNVFYATLAIYAVLGLITVFVLRLLANVPLPESRDGA